MPLMQIASISEQLSELRGTPSHPANAGKLCVKGSHLLETNISEGRLRYPHVDGERVQWDTAYDKVAEAMSQTILEYGPESVAFYLSGQLLTEDYYVANKLMKGFVGSANVDTNSRLCMSSAVAAYKRAFGSDTVLCCYDDLSNTDLLVLIGSNAAWTHPILFQKMQAAKASNPDLKIILIDPRSTATASQCDLHLAIKPGTDAWLFNGLLQYIHDNQAVDLSFVSSATQGFKEALASANALTPADVAAVCEISESDLTHFYESFVSSPRAISFYSMGINQSTSGVDKANSIINCHLASGKIGKVGCGPFSITGQPNAMGGREVGGLSNMLAAHMDIDNAEHVDLVQRFWQAPNMVKKLGYKAVDMFDAMALGKIKFIWVMGTNPVVSMPNRHLIEDALTRCPNVVVSDIVEKNDTIKFANIVLPACGWSEKDGTVTNSERCISRQRGLVTPIAEAKPDWEILCQVAKRLGFEDAFSYDNVSQIFCEHAALTGFENKGQRDLDISGLANLTEQQYNALKPVQWPINANAPLGTARMFTDNKFFTPSAKANFIAISPRKPEQLTSADYPFVLNTGRMRDQWHTMTRTGNARKLHQHIEQAYLYVHPDDLKVIGCEDGDLVQLHSSVSSKEQHDALIVPIKIDSKQRKGEVFCPIHWSQTYGSHLKLAALFSSAADPISGQPELKHAAVSIRPVKTDMQMLIYSKQAIPAEALTPLTDYYVQTVQEHAFVYRLALLLDQKTATLQHRASDIQAWEKTVMQSLSDKLETLTFHDAGVEAFQRVYVQSNELEYFTITSKQKPTVHKAWMDDLFQRGLLENADIHALLHYVPDPAFEQGKLICSCFKVHEHSITQAIRDGATSVSSLGEKLKCGTNCGSCKSELSELVLETQSESYTPKKPNSVSVIKGEALNTNASVYNNDKHSSGNAININVEM